MLASKIIKTVKYGWTESGRNAWSCYNEAQAGQLEVISGLKTGRNTYNIILEIILYI